MRWRPMLVVMALIAALALSQPAAAQSGSGANDIREASFSIGSGRLSHGDDPLGSGLTLGGALTIPVMRRFAVRIDGHRSLGPNLNERSCASFPTSPCTGVGRYGVRGLTIWSATGVYYFSPGRAQPYVTGGLDVLDFTFVSDVTTFRGGQVTITDFEQQNTTMGITLGGGVRVAVGRRLSVTPEVRIYDGTILSGANLAQLRASIGVGYRF
jgi:opacity protein-like surface antigen